MDWRLYANINDHPDPPPERPYMPRVRCCDDVKLTLARVRSIFDSNGTITDGGWSPWEYFAPTYWMGGGFALHSTDGSDIRTSEHRIEVAAGIGRPWKVIWRDKITDLDAGTFVYSTTQEQVVLPGDSLTINYAAASGKIREFDSALLLFPAEGS